MNAYPARDAAVDAAIELADRSRLALQAAVAVADPKLIRLAVAADEATEAQLREALRLWADARYETEGELAAAS